MRLRRHDLTFPRLDLPPSHITTLSLTTTLDVPLDRDLPDDGALDLFMDDTVSFYTAMAYRKSGMTHFVSAQLGDALSESFADLLLGDPTGAAAGNPSGASGEGPAGTPALDDPFALDDDRMQLEIGYAVDPTHMLPRPPGTLNHEANLLRWLGDDPAPKVWTCAITFDFEVAPGTPLPSWFPLPHEIAGEAAGAPSPLTEIRGIRGVKLANDDRSQPGAVEFSVVIDHAEDGRLLAVVEFTVNAPCSSKVPEMVLDRGREIGQDLRLPA